MYIYIYILNIQNNKQFFNYSWFHTHAQKFIYNSNVRSYFPTSGRLNLTPPTMKWKLCVNKEEKKKKDKPKSTQQKIVQ